MFPSPHECRFSNQVESDIKVAERYFGSLVYTRNRLMFDQPTDRHATRFFEIVVCGWRAGDQVDQLLVARACARVATCRYSAGIKLCSVLL